MTVLVFLLVLSVLVLAHELGHFVTAKRAGAKVEEFGFGFPPRVFAFKKNGTEYSLNLIPFGGFVKIFGETGEHYGEPGSFSSLRLGRRAKIVVAGVAMNMILAFALLSFNNLWGKPDVITAANEKTARDIQLQIVQVSEGSPAEKAGLKAGDAVLRIALDGETKSFTAIEDFKAFVDGARGREVKISVQRGKEIFEASARPRVSPPADEGALGVGLARTGLVRTSWYLAWWQGLKDTLNLFWIILLSLGLLLKVLIFEGKMIGEVMGPIGIAGLAGQAFSMGLAYLVNLVAILSVHLAIINILPFPALDGGRLVMLGVEKIKGSPLGQRWEQAINVSGFAVLIALMLFITWKDIAKLF